VADREGRARPERHPQPGQARPREPLRRGSLAVSTGRVLVVDVGTSSVRAAVVRSDGSFAGTHDRETLPDSPADGPVQFDETCLDLARAALAADGPVDAVGISDQRGSTIVWDRATGVPVGPGLGWQDLRTIGACLALRAAGVRVGPNQSATKVQWLLDQPA